ncbi:hybrid sensor histidine kinase/response regulator [Synoicihabitans lomoniglobus]|uniref:histidine kinase n=1 Tax=Synoicihabitans lomoniglobus TaxID=2909285 RepID=A0AAF0A025_9BACT|nr:response regulator [Opitutaceae bacterium LMO-M01]WED64708.1 response regulator [Opitutaceae bacterium LMO-M01]
MPLSPIPLPHPLRVLIVDDVPEDCVEIRRLLSRGQENDWDITTVNAAESAIDVIARQLPHCLLMDLDLVRMSGKQLLDHVIETYGPHACGMVMLTASDSTSIAVELLKSGAHDYLQKGKVTAVQLRKAVRNAVEKATIRREISASRAELQNKNTALSEAVADLTRESNQRERAEDALRKSERRFRNLADNISQLAWMTDETGYIFWYNKRWFDYTGTTLDEMRGWGWRKVHHPDHEERVVRKISECFESGSSWEDTFPLRARNGSYRWFLSRAVPIHDNAGKVQGWFGTNTDITHQLEIEDALKSARDQALAASRAKDDFLAALSHELRTPLNPVLLTASERARDPNLPAEIRHDFGSIRKNISLEARLIDDLLDLTRITRGKLTLRQAPLELLEVLDDALAIVQAEFAEKKLQWNVTRPDAPIPLHGDAVRLRQVFWNVLKNAAKFSPEKGEIVIDLSFDAAAVPADARATLTVSDSGIGLSSEELSRIFDAFSQGDHSTKSSHRFGGLGLGLAISRSLVELHHGTIQACSEGPCRGATFVITLPTAARPGDETYVAPTAAPRSRATTRSPHPGTTARRVLLVEDHAPTRTTMTRLLRQRGFEVSTAATRAEALDVRRHGHIDALLSDIGLPDGDGCTLLNELRQHWPRLEGIALSGYGMEEDLKRSQRHGFVLHLTKPLEIDQLDQALAQLAEHLGAPPNSTT